MQTVTYDDVQMEQLMQRVLGRYSVFNRAFICERVASYDDVRAKRLFLEELATIEAKDCPADAPKRLSNLMVYYDPNDFVYCVQETQ